MLVRHASCALTDQVLLGRAIDAPLDEHGERQAAALARHVACEAPAIVLTSPRRRALLTAGAIAALARSELRVAPEFDEIDFGAWSGQPFAALERDPRWREWNAHRESACTPAGVAIASVQRQIATQVRTLARHFEGRSVVLVTHAEIVRSALLHFLHMPASDWYCIEIGTASVSVLSVAESGVRIDTINERAPFEERIAA
jgi:probable phosphoglycerate mutase